MYFGNLSSEEYYNRVLKMIVLKDYTTGMGNFLTIVGSFHGRINLRLIGTIFWY